MEITLLFELRGYGRQGGSGGHIKTFWLTRGLESDGGSAVLQRIGTEPRGGKKGKGSKDRTGTEPCIGNFAVICVEKEREKTCGSFLSYLPQGATRERLK